MLFANYGLFSPLQAHVRTALPDLLWLDEATRPVLALNYVFLPGRTFNCRYKSFQGILSYGIATAIFKMAAALSS